MLVGPALGLTDPQEVVRDLDMYPAELAINARAETLTERPMFRGAVAKARCLIPADGSYEWQVRPGQKMKQPVYIRLRDASIFTFGGPYTVRQDGEATVWSCAIITTAPNALMEPIHNRMPVTLDPDAAKVWLDPTVTNPAAVVSPLQPYPAERMVAWRVSPSYRRYATTGRS